VIKSDLSDWPKEKKEIRRKKQIGRMLFPREKKGKGLSLTTDKFND
jgi:hypothetical protein